MQDHVPIKICIASSAGGHLSQILKLTAGWQEHEAFYITTTGTVHQELKKLGRVYVVGECNREYPARVLKVLLRCIKIVFHEKPNVVISTGAAVGCIVCFLSKLFGARVVWIDSITNVERISLSGRMVKYIADLFLVQWSELVRQYKNIEYIGTVI